MAFLQQELANSDRCDGLTGGATKHARQLPHAACDPLIDGIEYFAILLHGIADGPRFDRVRVEIAEEYHIAGPSPEALTHLTPLRRIHHDDEIGGPYQIGSHEARPVIGEVHTVTLRRGHSRGGWRPVKPDEAGGLHLDIE